MDALAAYSGVFFLICWVIATTALWLRDRFRARHAAGRHHATRRALLFLLCGSPPWIVMSLGNLIAGMHNPMDFVNPQNGPFAVLFIMSVVWVWVALLYWLFVKGGAEELAESGHISFIGVPISDPKHVKLYFVVCAAAGVGFGLAWYFIH
jgi:hypothetical protein